MGGVAAARGFAVVRQMRTVWLRAILSSRFSVRAHVIGLILVIIAPLLAFSAFLVLRFAAHEQDFMASSVRERTREAAAAIDHELGALRTRLFILAGSGYLQTGDLTAFHAQALEAVSPDGLNVELSDPDGRELVNTRARRDTGFGMAADPAVIRHVATTLLPEISNLTKDTVTGETFIAISVPVLNNGRAVYVLSLNIAPLLPRILADLNLPPDWLVAIDDRAGTTVARNREAGRFVGQMGTTAALEHFRSADDGWFPLTSREGIPAYIAFAHVRFSGWTVAVGIPDAVLFAPVRRSTWILILAGGMALAFALMLAAAIGRRIAGAITGLADYAEVVGRGEHISQPVTGIWDTDAVARSLHLASERIQQSAQERAVLLDRTVTAQEAERRRIARELHDSLGQYLTALRLGFSAIEPHCACDPTAQQKLAELKTLAAALGRELNRIAWELRPMALDDLGLHRAVTQYLEEWAERSRLQVDLEINLHDRRLPQSVETALFRVLQEAVTNVVKHSGADRVGVILDAADNEVRLIVEDDGHGFDMANGADGRDLGMQRLGLLGVRERLALVGGSLEVESSEQGGTTVYVRIPL
jgi:signal transduction histidine kinase